VRPTGSGNASGNVWETPEDSDLATVPASKAVKLEAWSMTMVDTNNPSTIDFDNASFAYEVGSLATGRDGGVYICDPFAASGNWDYQDVLLDFTIAGTDYFRWIVKGCCENSP